MVDFPFYIIVGLYAYDSYMRLRRTVSQAPKALSYHLNEAYLNMPTADGILYRLNLSPIPRTFPQFSKLPFEIRALIWQFGLPGPRVIAIRNHPGAYTGQHEDTRSYWDDFAPKIYVDFSKDVIHFGPKSHFYLAQAQQIPGREHIDDGLRAFEDLRKIKFLAQRSRTWGNAMNMKLEQFGALEEVICVAGTDFEIADEPRLMTEESGEIVVNSLAVSRHVVDLGMLSQRKEVENPEWKMPVIEKGRFVRGKGSM